MTRPARYRALASVLEIDMMTSLLQHVDINCAQSWLQLSEQFPAKDKCRPAGFRSSRAPGVGCDAGGRSPTVCAWHGRWIGGESPSRGEMVATASRRRLHAVSAVARRQCWGCEAVWGRSPRRTAAPNESEPLCKPDRPGQRVWKRDAQNPFEAGAVLGAGAAGHPVILPREVCVGSRER